MAAHETRVAMHLQHVADDLHVLDDVVRSVDEEARGHAVEGARVLRHRVHLPGQARTWSDVETSMLIMSVHLIRALLVVNISSDISTSPCVARMARAGSEAASMRLQTSLASPEMVLNAGRAPRQSRRHTWTAGRRAVRPAAPPPSCQERSPTQTRHDDQISGRRAQSRAGYRGTSC